ncbi:hypothetical protein VOLCADRAFT_90298 [Volvox carteri f. nagariensis]|uniref:Uncharacterized protein n=1 Tax=Volvox carteri f. nagariensis TaxID=3068 RepID=D8TU03_VOLCA|nr:uncharacterized protein VOLCADRAFT_90298 [Volvox carteri f. nagariensis]EFJ49058.1 hypothetical protein VOLCADRAFT_90298 [Volvox carteri f. nagariensis]|eukprot:XP_002949955.1 hypothetical protein VOLCADRAFT_90298 [Volvox carteri f. nagariensis]
MYLKQTADDDRALGIAWALARNAIGGDGEEMNFPDRPPSYVCDVCVELSIWAFRLAGNTTSLSLSADACTFPSERAAATLVTLLTAVGGRRVHVASECPRPPLSFNAIKACVSVEWSQSYKLPSETALWTAAQKWNEILAAAFGTCTALMPGWYRFEFSANIVDQACIWGNSTSSRAFDITLYCYPGDIDELKT